MGRSHFGLFFPGQNIGLCNGKLKAMSGEELDQLAEAELSSTVKNVMVLITKPRPISNSNCLIQDHIFCFSGFHFLQNKSKAQTENNKGTKYLLNPLYVSLKQDIRGGREEGGQLSSSISCHWTQHFSCTSGLKYLKDTSEILASIISRELFLRTLFPSSNSCWSFILLKIQSLNSWSKSHPSRLLSLLYPQSHITLLLFHYYIQILLLPTGLISSWLQSLSSLHSHRLCRGLVILCQWQEMVLMTLWPLNLLISGLQWDKLVQMSAKRLPTWFLWTMTSQQ